MAVKIGETSQAAAAAAAVENASQRIPRARYAKSRSLEPIYTGGAGTVLTSNGRFIFAPVDQVVVGTDVMTGRTICRIGGDTEDVSALALSPDDATLAIASRSTSLRIFSLEQTSDNVGGIQIKAILRRNITKSHEAPAAVMRIDPTSSLLATGAADGCAKVWDLAGAFCTHVFRNHSGIVSALAWNTPTNELNPQKPNFGGMRRFELFTGDIDGKIRLWNLRPGSSGLSDRMVQRPLAVLDAHFSVVRGLTVSDDGSKLVSASRDRMLSFWERREALSSSYSSKKGETNGAYPDQSWRLCESVTAGESLETVGFLRRGSVLPAKGVEMDGQDLFWTGGAEGEIRIWSFASRAVVAHQPGGRWASSQLGTKTHKHRHVVRESIEELDGDETRRDEDEIRAITEVHYAAPMNTLVSVHADQNFSFRSAPAPAPASVSSAEVENLTEQQPLSRLRQLVGFNDQIIDLMLLSPGQAKDSHLAVATNSTSLKVYQFGTDEHDVQMLPSAPYSAEGHQGLILCLDKSQDAKWLISGSKDATARIWALLEKPRKSGEIRPDEPRSPQWRCVAVAKGHTESVGAVAFARRNDSHGHPPFVATGSQDRTAKIWDLSVLADHIASMQLNSDVEPLSLSTLTTLKIHDKDINALDVAPNNALLLSGSQDKTAKVFSISYIPPSKANHDRASASLKQLSICRAHKRGVWSVAFSPTDAAFVTASGDRTVRLWSLATFGCVKTFEGHTNAVLRARFLPQSRGMQLLTSASDGLVKLWNVRDETCVDTLDGHEDRVWGLECRQDAMEIISGGADGMIRVWQDRTDLDVEQAAQQREIDVEREQLFVNLVARHDYRNAIALALSMEQPRRLFDLFTSVDTGRERYKTFEKEDKTLISFSSNDDDSDQSITGSHAVDEVIRKMPSNQLIRFLAYIRDWNTSARTAGTAQTVLHAVLRLRSAEDVINSFERQANNDNGKGSVEKGKTTRAPELASIIDALIPYTERHYARAERILTESCMLEYTLEAMDTFLGPDIDQEQVQSLQGNGSTASFVNFKVHADTVDVEMSED